MCNTLRPKLQMFDNTRIKVDGRRPHSLMFVCQNLVTSSGSCFNFQVTRDFARQFTYYQSLNCCLALITIIMPPAATLQTQIRGPSYCPSITKYAYIQHGGRNCKFINFEIVYIKHILEPNAGVLARNARPLQKVFILARPVESF